MFGEGWLNYQWYAPHLMSFINPNPTEVHEIEQEILTHPLRALTRKPAQLFNLNFGGLFLSKQFCANEE